MADEKQDAIQKVEPVSRAAVAVGRQGVVLSNFAELMAFAKVCTEAGIGPKGMSQASAAIAIQAGLERGMGPLGGLQSAVVINGVLSWRGSAVVGMIQNSGVVVPGTWRSWVENPGTELAVGYCRALRRGYAEPFIRSFSVQDAKKAGLWKKGGPWDSRPDNMLEWRAIGDMGRFHFYDVLGNLPIAEDVEAGGIGPTEPRELPAERQPAPTIQVLDPALVELLPSGQALKAEIDKSVDEAFPRTSLEPVIEQVRAQVLADPKLPKDAVLFVNRDGTVAGRITNLGSELILAGQPCPRCQAKINAMLGCDVCGWPGADNGERP